MKEKARPSRNEGGLGRREFLLLTSSCAAATLALGPNLFAGVLSSDRQLAVGYAPMGAIGSDELFALASADALNSSDGYFLRKGVHVKLAGFGLGDESRRTLVFRPHYIIDGSTDVPVDAWRFTRSTSAAGGRVSFVMPIEVDQRLRFSLLTGPRNLPVAHRRAIGAPAAPDAEQSLDITFSLLNESDVVKLMRGYYVIVPLYDGAAAPRWNATTLRIHDGNVLMHEMRDGIAQPVQREHFVLRFDYATPGF